MNFRIHHTSKYYWEVLIFDTWKQMYTFYDDTSTANLLDLTRTEKKHDFDACVLPTKAYKFRGNPKYQLGFILFYKKASIDIIAHELLHATMWYDRMVNRNKQACYGWGVTRKEERLAEISASLFQTFFHEWRKRVK